MKDEVKQLYLEYISKRRMNPDPEQIGPYFGGFLNGSEILFVGQNFGAPLKTDNLFMNNINEYKNDYDSLMTFFEEQWWTSRFGGFLINVLGDLNLYRRDISFTNLAIWMTNKNVFPQITKLEYDLFKNELEIVHPKLIIYLSSTAKSLIEQNLYNLNCPRMYFAHPASFRYSSDYKTQIVTRIKSTWKKTI